MMTSAEENFTSDVQCVLFYKMGETTVSNSSNEDSSLPKVNLGLCVFLSMQTVGALLWPLLYKTELDFLSDKEQVELVGGEKHFEAAETHLQNFAE